MLITNDSDLKRPIKIARRLGYPVGLICPFKKVSKALQSEASFVRSIKVSALQRSQFPDAMRDRKGQISRPKGW